MSKYFPKLYDRSNENVKVELDLQALDGAASMDISNVADNDIVKKLYNQLITNANAINTKIASTSGLFTKTKYDSDKQGLEKIIEDVDKEIPITSGLVQKTDCNTKITEIENKMLSIIGLVSTTAINTLLVLIQLMLIMLKIFTSI